MPKVGQLNEHPEFKALIWSKSGTGKTRLIGSASPLGDMYIFDFDNRLQGLAADYPDIEYDFYRDLDPKKPMAFDAARKKLDQLATLNPFPYAAVALDSLTTFQIAAMNKSMVHTKAFMTNLTRIKDTTSGVEVPVMQDYQGAMAYIEQFLMKLITLPCHVFVAAHEEADKDPVSEKMHWNLAVSGKLAIRIPGLFNELWRMRVVQTSQGGSVVNSYQLVTRSDSQFSARTSYPDVIKHIETPDFANIYSRVMAWIQQKSKPALP